MVSPKGFISSCSAFSSDDRKEEKKKVKCLQVEKLVFWGGFFGTATQNNDACGVVSYPHTDRWALSTWPHWRRGHSCLCSRWSSPWDSRLESLRGICKWCHLWMSHTAGGTDTSQSRLYLFPPDNSLHIQQYFFTIVLLRHPFSSQHRFDLSPFIQMFDYGLRVLQHFSLPLLLMICFVRVIFSFAA